MPRLILIETSTSLCSTALVEGEEISCRRESAGQREHASKTAVFIKEMLDGRGLKASDCDAVCVSSGPGSYTGLRVGSSSAKGLCFGAGIPLIAIGTLDILAHQAVSEGLLPEGCRTIVPMIDARRMEVYSAVYSLDTECQQSESQRPSETAECQQSESQCPSETAVCQQSESQCPSETAVCLQGEQQCSSETAVCLQGGQHWPLRTAARPERHRQFKQISEISPLIIATDSFEDLLAAGPVLFIGDGAAKCAEVIKSPNATFIQECPKASAMLEPALKAWNEKRFENTAYFEPFYLKEFVATVSHKNMF